MTTLILLLAVLAPAKTKSKPSAAPPQHFQKVKAFDTNNKLGRYLWFDERYALLEDMTGENLNNGLFERFVGTALDTQDLSTRVLEFPLVAWAERNSTRLFDKKPWAPHFRTGRPSGRVRLTSIVHYDGRNVFVLIENDDGALGDAARARTFLVRWPEEAVLSLGEVSVHVFRSIAVRGGRWYFEQTGAPVQPPLSALTLGYVELGKMERKDVITFPARVGGYWHASASMARVAFAEYTELSNGALDPPAKVYVIDVATGERFDVPAPVSPYGGAWTPDDASLFLGSNELGTISRIDVATRTVTEVAKGHRGIQYFHLTPNNQTLLVMTRGTNVARYSVSPFKVQTPLAIASFLDGKPRFSWDWSVLSPDRKQALLSKNVLDGTVDFLDGETPGVTLFKVLDAP